MKIILITGATKKLGKGIVKVFIQRNTNSQIETHRKEREQFLKSFIHKACLGLKNYFFYAHLILLIPKVFSAYYRYFCGAFTVSFAIHCLSYSPLQTVWNQLSPKTDDSIWIRYASCLQLLILLLLWYAHYF